VDPNMFYIDWTRVSEVLVAIVIVSFILERGLALLFETRWFISRYKDRSLKEPIAFIVAAFVCIFWEFDAVSAILLKEKMTVPGELITAGIVAGGSKASIKLFRDVLKLKSAAQQELEDTRTTERKKKEGAAGSTGSASGSPSTASGSGTEGGGN